MDTLDDFRARYSRSSDDDLLAIVAIDAEYLAPESLQALVEEITRRGLRPGVALPYNMPVAPAAAPGIVAQRRYPKAPFGPRVLAYLIDAGVALGGVIAAGLALAFTGLGQRNTGSTVLIIVVAALWAVYYSFTKDGREGGQSFGKEMLNLMVVNINTNQPCSIGESALRTLILGLLNAVPLVGFLVEPIVALTAEDGRRLGDRVANTQVIETSAYVPSRGA